MSVWDIAGIFAVLVLVAANGFFVAAEFSLVAVRRSRVSQLVQEGVTNAKALHKAVDALDSHLAATQLGITLASLALGWVGEPALAHLIEPPLAQILGEASTAVSHIVAVVIAFVIITVLHIVVGELAPKSLALQRSENTALWVVRPLGIFLVVFRPAITVLNGLGNMLLRAVGLKPTSGEEGLHSTEEIKLLVAENQRAGVLHSGQQEAVGRVFDIGNRSIEAIMTPRHEVDWIDISEDAETMRAALRASRHRILVAANGSIDEPIGVISKKDLLEQVLEGLEMDPAAAVTEALIVLDTSRVFPVLEQFKTQPVRIALVVDEYGTMQGIVTQSDLLSALAGDIADEDDLTADVQLGPDGTAMIDGGTSIAELAAMLDLSVNSENYHTAAGFALDALKRLPKVGDSFVSGSYRFTIMALEGRRISLIKAQPEDATG